jgi:hypothetical protein
MMTLIAPSLEDMGIVLFGLDWREPLANSLGVPEEAVAGSDNNSRSHRRRTSENRYNSDAGNRGDAFPNTADRRGPQRP